jgi:hypothetical protein
MKATPSIKQPIFFHIAALIKADTNPFLSKARTRWRRAK